MTRWVSGGTDAEKRSSQHGCSGIHKQQHWRRHLKRSIRVARRLDAEGGAGGRTARVLEGERHERRPDRSHVRRPLLLLPVVQTGNLQLTSY
jgi:hypothetical protein